MTDHPEPVLQATANLSPECPSPVHTATPLVVPALQNTADTIEAMVAAVTAADGAPAAEPVANGSNPAAPVPPEEDNDDIVDDDSFDDAYGDDADPTVQAQPQPVGQDADNDDDDDDYAKTFDSPAGSEDGGDADAPDHVPSIAPESNSVALQSDAPPLHSQNGTPAVSTSVADNTATPQQAATTIADSAAQAQPAAQSQAAHDLNAPAANSASFADTQDAEATLNAQQPESAATSLPSTNNDANGSPQDIQQLVADLTAQPSESTAGNDPDANKTDSPAATASATPSSALPSPSSLPPRPPIPHSDSAAQSYSTQPLGTQTPTAAQPTPTPGHHAPFVTAGAPGTSTDAVGSLPPPPTTGHSPAALGPINSTAPSYASSGYSNPQSHNGDYQRMWDQFMADERQYMSEAKWDRFPEGSRLFIGVYRSFYVYLRFIANKCHR